MFGEGERAMPILVALLRSVLEGEFLRAVVGHAARRFATTLTARYRCPMKEELYGSLCSTKALFFDRHVF